MEMKRMAFLVVFLASFAAQGASCPAPRSIDFQVTKTILRQSPGFTQGLEFDDGVLYESTGAYPAGVVTKLNRISATGEVTPLYQHSLKDVGGSRVFGEGLTILKGEIFQLTYTNGVAYVYDKQGNLKRELRSPLREGWGLANNGADLIATDGSDQLIFLDPQNLSIKKKVTVRDDRGPVPKLNEIEFVNGKIFANVFGTNDILQIDPETGCVTAVADMTNLIRQIPPAFGNPLQTDRNFVLNGIAFDESSDQFYLTGKNWPVLFQTKMVESPKPKPPALKPGPPSILRPPHTQR